MLEFVDHRVWQKLLEDFGPHIDQKLHERHQFDSIGNYLFKKRNSLEGMWHMWHYHSDGTINL